MKKLENKNKSPPLFRGPGLQIRRALIFGNLEKFFFPSFFEGALGDFFCLSSIFVLRRGFRDFFFRLRPSTALSEIAAPSLILYYFINGWPGSCWGRVLQGLGPWCPRTVPFTCQPRPIQTCQASNYTLRAGPGSPISKPVGGVCAAYTYTSRQSISLLLPKMHV